MKKTTLAFIAAALLMAAVDSKASFIVNEYNNVPNYAAFTGKLNSNAAPSLVTSATVINYLLAGSSDGAFGNNSAFPNSQTTSFGLDIKTNLIINTAGTYFFRTASDDGVKLFIDGAAVITQTGVFPITTFTSPGLLLGVGLHSLELQYFQAAGNASLELSSSRTNNGAFALIGSATGLQTTVPEPASIALLGIGLLGFATTRRKSTK